MTNMKKKAQGKSAAGEKKLQLRKQTLKDLNSLKDKAAAVKGGRGGACCGGNTFTHGD